MIKSAFTTIFCFWLLCFFSCKIDRNTKYNEKELGLDKITEIPSTHVDNNGSNNIRGDWQKPGLVVSKFGDLNGKTVVDIGAGSGYFMTHLMQKASKVIAIDIDQSAIEILNIVKSAYPKESQDRIDIRLTPPDKPALKNEEVDAALLVNTVTYFEDRIGYFKKLKTALKTGGSFIIVDYKMKKLAIDAPLGDQRLNPLQIEEDLEEAGFAVRWTDDCSLEYQYIILAQKI